MRRPTHVVAHSVEAIGLFRLDAARWVIPEEIADAAALRSTTILRLLWTYQSLRAMAWFRFGSAAQRSGIPLVPGWTQRRLLRLYGLQLEPGASVGGGFYIAHPVGCVLFAEHIGTNVSVIAAATFGTRGDGAWPRIGDATFFGAGARVLGGIAIGDGARIGANAVAIHDVEPGATAVGAPARVVRTTLDEKEQLHGK